jgi:hypothetical protein
MGLFLLAAATLPAFIQHLVEVEGGIEGRSVVTGVARSPRHQILIDLV